MYTVGLNVYDWQCISLLVNGVMGQKIIIYLPTCTMLTMRECLWLTGGHVSRQERRPRSRRQQTEPVQQRQWWLHSSRQSLTHGVCVCDLVGSCICYQTFCRWWSFVCSLRAGVQPTLHPSTETFWISPMCQPRQRRGVDRCVWCERYVGWRRESRLEQLVMYF